MKNHRKLRRRIVRKLLPIEWLDLPGISVLLGMPRVHGHLVDVVMDLRLEYSLDSVVGQLLFREGEFEESEARFIEDLLKPGVGAVVLDIGANIGVHSLRAARLPGVREVLAFEPARSTFAMLKRNVERNGLTEKIRVFPLAVSNRPGRAEFHFCRDDAYSSLVPDFRSPVKETYDVAVITLDEWCATNAVNRIDLIKIDVEGGEADVIAGAQSIIRQCQPKLIVEIIQGKHRNYAATSLIDHICSLGYEAFVLIGGHAVPFTHHDNAHINYYFVPRR